MKDTERQPIRLGARTSGDRGQRLRRARVVGWGAFRGASAAPAAERAPINWGGRNGAERPGLYRPMVSTYAAIVVGEVSRPVPSGHVSQRS